MFYDLNLKLNPNSPTPIEDHVKSCIEDGYSGVAFNVEKFDQLTEKDKNEIKKIDVPALLQKSGIDLVTKPDQKYKVKNFKLLSRLTYTTEDTRHIQQLNESNHVVKSYDIIAARATKENIFYTLCLENDIVDIISFDLTQKLPFKLKKGPVLQAVKRGIFFEITYSNTISDPTVRRMVFANAIQIIKATKGQNIIVTSGATDPIAHRGPYDVICMSMLWELTQDEAKKAVADNQLQCIKQAEQKKNFRGTISFATKDEQQLFEEKELKFKAQKKVKTGGIIEEQKLDTEEEQANTKIASTTKTLGFSLDIEAEKDSQQKIVDESSEQQGSTTNNVTQ